MSHKHRDEIIRWANSPEGTRIWNRRQDKTGWVASTPDAGIGWLPDYIYIVDDEWAELRKAQADGKQLQYEDINGEWKDDIFTLEKSKYYTIEQWRIKPEKVYEWQWIYKDANGVWNITDDWHRYWYSNYATEIQKWEPSKRIKKESQQNESISERVQK